MPVNMPKKCITRNLYGCNMKNVICIYHVPQECGSNCLIFVDTFDGQVLKTIEVNYFRDWDAEHKDIIVKDASVTFYRHLSEFIKVSVGKRCHYDGDEYFSAYTTKELKKYFHPKGDFIITDAKIIDHSSIVGPHNKPMETNIWEITMAEYEETDYKYHPEEDRFYKELADQGIDLPVMSGEEWLITKIEDIINWIAGQLGFRVLNIINC